MSERRAILANLAFFPVRLLCLALSMAWMVVTAPFLLLAIYVTLIPGILSWCASPFVGLVSPSAGSRLADFMESCTEALMATIEFIWSPLGPLSEVGLWDFA